MEARKNNSVSQTSADGQTAGGRSTQQQLQQLPDIELSAPQRQPQRPQPQSAPQQQPQPALQRQPQQRPQPAPQRQPQSAPQRQPQAAPQQQPQAAPQRQRQQQRQPQSAPQRQQQPQPQPPEIMPAQKQPATKKKKTLIIVLVVVLVLAIAAAAYLIIKKTGASSAAASDLDEAISIIEEADQVVIAVDKAISQEVSQDSVDDLEMLVEKIPATITKLKSAETLAKDAQSVLKTQDDKDLAAAVVNSASGRVEMLTQGKSLLEADIAAMQSSLLITEAMEKASQADAKMREALEYAASSSTIQQAKDLDQAAVDLLQEAVDNLAKITTELMPKAQLDAITNYLNAKLESAKIAVDADTAFADKDAAKVAELNESYAQKDAEVVELAKLIPEDPLTLIYSAYEEAVSSMRAAYVNARNKATEADSFLRDYLGVTASQDDSSSADTQDSDADDDSSVVDSIHGFEVSDLAA